MKKFLILTITAAVLLTLLSACGAIGRIDPTLEPAQPMPSAEAPTDAKAEFSMGTIDAQNATYTNEYTGLHFALPEGWSFASEEELASLISAGAQSVYDDKAGSMEDILELTTLYDMMAGNGSESIVVLFENLRYHIGGITLTESGYAEMLAEQLSATQGLTYSVDAPAAAQLAGLDGIVLNASLGDADFHQSYFISKTDEHMLVIIFTAAESPAWESLRSCFTGE